MRTIIILTVLAVAFVPDVNLFVNAGEPVKEYYLRISFDNDTSSTKLTKKYRLWIRGYGEFLPGYSDDGRWRFGGSLLEKAGPFKTSEEQKLIFYTNYPDEKTKMVIPVKYAKGMSLNGSVRDMISFTISDTEVEVTGSPLKNSSLGKFSIKFDAKTGKVIPYKNSNYLFY